MSSRSSKAATYRILNVKALVILIVGSIVFAASLFGIHVLQVGRSAEKMLLQAERQEKEGNYAAAAKSYSHYVGLKPRDEAGQAKLGHALAKSAKSTAQIRQAADLLAKSAAADPNKLDDLRQAAELYIQIRAFKEAKDHLDTLLKANPNDSSAQYFRAVCEIGLKEYDSADKRLTEVIKSDPSMVRAYSTQANLLRNQLPSGKAGDVVMDRMVANNPKSADAYLERARYRRRYGLPGVMDDVNQAEKFDAKLPDLPLFRADDAARQGKVDIAVKIIRDELAAHPTQEALITLLAKYEMQSGKSADAVKTLQDGVEKFPENNDMAFTLADYMIQAGRLKETQELLAKLREKKLPEALLNFLEASILMREGKWDLAQQQFDKAAVVLQGIPELAARTYYAIGLCQERLNSYEAALASYRKALGYNPSSTVVLERVARCLTALNRLDEAAESYRKLSAGNTDSASGLIAQLQLKVANQLQLPETRRNWNECERLVADVEKQFPNTVAAVLARVDLLNARGQTDEALKMLADAKTKFPKRSDLWVASSGLLLSRGDFDQALKQLDSAPNEAEGQFAVRFAKISYWDRRGGPTAGAELDKLGQNVNTFSPTAQLLLLEALTRANMKLGRFEEARKTLAQLLEKAPDDADKRLLEIELADRTRSEEGVTAALNQLRRIEGERGITWRMIQARRLLARATNGDRQVIGEIKRLISELESLKSGTPQIVSLKADLDIIENHEDQAISQLRLAIRQGNRQPQLVQRLMQLLDEQGRYQDADRDIRELEQQGILDVESRKVAARLALRSGNRARAAELSRSAVKPSTTDPLSLIWLGQMLVDTDPSTQGRADALASFTQATVLAPTLLDGWIALIEYQMAIGNRADALATFNKALTQIGPANKTYLEALGNLALNRRDLAKIAFEKVLVERPEDRGVLRRAAGFFQLIEQFRRAEQLLRKWIALNNGVESADLHSARIALAVLLSRTGSDKDAAEALALIDANLKSQPNSLRDKRAKIDILSQMPDRRKDAIALLQELKAGGESLTPLERVRLARLYEADDLWDAARREMTSLINSPQATSQIIATYVSMLLQHGSPTDLTEASDMIDKLTTREPKSLTPIEFRAQWLVTSKRPDDAAKLLESFAQANPDALLLVAASLERLNLQQAAERSFKAFTAKPGNPNAVLALAEYYGRQKRYPEAFAILESARKTCAAESVATSLILTIDNSKSDVALNKKAAEMLESLLKSDAALKSSPLPLMLAVVNTRLGKYDEAIKLYESILSDRPNDIGTLNNLAWLLSLQKRADVAKPMIDRVISEFGPSPKFLDTRGVVYLGLNKPEEAANDFRDSIAGRPDDLPAVYFHLAQAEHQAKRDSEAKSALQTGIKLGLNAEYLETPERPAFEELSKILSVSK